VNLVKNEAIPRFIENVAAGYEREIGIKPEIYVSRAASGVGEVA